MNKFRITRRCGTVRDTIYGPRSLLVLSEFRTGVCQILDRLFLSTHKFISDSLYPPPRSVDLPYEVSFSRSHDQLSV